MKKVKKARRWRLDGGLVHGLRARRQRPTVRVGRRRAGTIDPSDGSCSRLRSRTRSIVQIGQEMTETRESPTNLRIDTVTGSTFRECSSRAASTRTHPWDSTATAAQRPRSTHILLSLEREGGVEKGERTRVLEESLGKHTVS